MPRISRKMVSGNYFHVMIQGYNKEFIFKETKLKERLQETIFKKGMKNNVKIIAFCIMDNHAHILVKINSTQDLSKMMAGINTSFAKYYNYIKRKIGICI